MGRLRHPFWTLVAIRLAFWLGTALALLWSPVTDPKALPPDRAWGPLSDVFFGAYEHWDAQWFLHIAKDGYNSTSAAFFPLYPALLHLAGSSLAAGTLISLVAAGFAAWCLAEIARPHLGDDGARDTVLLLALFPTAFVFCSLYSDALFLALSAASFLAATRGRPWLAGVAGGLAVETRLIGLALLAPLAVLLWERRRPWRLAPLLLLPAAVGLFALYLRWKIGDPWAFRDAQVFWQRKTATLGPLGGLWMAIQAGGHGGLEILRHLPRGTGAPAGFTPTDRLAFWNAAHLVLLVPAGWLTWYAWRRLGAAFGAYSLATLLVVLAAPSKGFPLVSLPRFLMDDFPLIVALAALGRDRPALRQGLLIAFAALGAVASVAFSHRLWVA